MPETCWVRKSVHKVSILSVDVELGEESGFFLWVGLMVGWVSCPSSWVFWLWMGWWSTPGKG